MQDHVRCLAMPKKPEYLSDADRETQLETMRNWFYGHYTDPVENTPYESAEGGYIYIWGGPYDPEDVLQNEFSGDVPDEVIDELVDELRGITHEWTGNPDEHAVDDYLFETGELEAHRASFHGALVTIDVLLH